MIVTYVHTPHMRHSDNDSNICAYHTYVTIILTILSLICLNLHVVLADYMSCHLQNNIQCLLYQEIMNVCEALTLFFQFSVLFPHVMYSIHTDCPSYTTFCAVSSCHVLYTYWLPLLHQFLCCFLMSCTLYILTAPLTPLSVLFPRVMYSIHTDCPSYTSFWLFT
jgi:hypothetical protein